MDDKYYVVRGNNSGVFAGEIVSRDGQEVAMKNARCLWYWEGAASLLQLAKDGVSNPSECKFTVEVEELTITDCIEIIPCSEKSAKQVKEIQAWTR